jgi:hypothetical protein
MAGFSAVVVVVPGGTFAGHVFVPGVPVIVNVCVVTGCPVGGLLVSPPPRSGQFNKQIALGGFSTLICAVPVAHSNVPGIVAFNCVGLMLFTVTAVSCPYVASPVKVTDDPPFCDVGMKPTAGGVEVPFRVIGIPAHVFEVESQYAADVGVMEVSTG